MTYIFRNLSSLSIISILIFFSSCEIVNKADEVISPKERTEYIIKAGMHSSSKGIGISKVTGTSMVYEVTFDSSAVYNTNTTENQADINKLFGSSDCGSKHHVNSARFGWRWFKDELQIFAYTYADEEQSNEFITVVEIGKPYEYEIKFNDNSYEFLLDGKQVSMPRSCSGEVDGYMLYPYFGGDEVAPHDITIVLNEIN